MADTTSTEEACRSVVVVVPAPMMTRLWLSTRIAALLGADKTIAVTMVTPDESDADACAAHGLNWIPLFRHRSLRTPTGLRYALGYFLHQGLAYRFNSIRGFRGFRERMQQSLRIRKIAAKEGVATFRIYGFPRPRSRLLFGLLSKLYAGSQRYRDVDNVIDEIQPALVVVAHVQNHFVTPYILASVRRRVPVLGVVGSWDQPTTKGPLARGVTQLLAQSRNVVDELEAHHHVPRSLVEVVGWVQMDDYIRNPVSRARAEVLASLGLGAGHRYILFGAYPERLGGHEPELCRRLARHLEASANVKLLVRGHPLDRGWHERFGGLRELENVTLLAPELRRLEDLKEQLTFADAVISSGGTILLDAAALDRPAIGIAHEDHDEPYFDRVARRYDMEHWSAVVRTGGIRLVKSDAELFQAVDRFVTNPNEDAIARERLRSEHLSPLDGNSADRIAAAISRAARALESSGKTC